MTEAEAKTKVCPLMRPASRVSQTPLPYCVGSACMAWRETGPYRNYAGDDRAILAAKEQGVSGFCGLAGQPS